MVRIASFMILGSAAVSAVFGAPIRVKRQAFQLLDYADFQISDGTAGNAQAEAAAVFLDPFDGTDLATLDDQVADDVETMRKAAEAAETDQFNGLIKSGGADADALQVGKIKNKVLKLTGEVQALNIKLAKAKAAGDDTASIESKIAAEQKKLDTNIATDTKSAGAASKGVTGGAASGSASSGSSSGSASASSDSSDSSASASASASAASPSASSSSSSSSGSASSSNTSSSSTSSAAGSFSLQDYAAFQISDGKAGTAQAEAAAVFLDPFDGVDLATLDDSVADDIETMRQAAEAAETDQFNSLIKSASGADADALQVGKIKNKVLKLTGEVQNLNIKLAKAQAAGDDTSSIETKIAAEQKKLDTNIATDTKSAGAASKGVA